MQEKTTLKNIISIVLITAVMLAVLFLAYHILKDHIRDAKEKAELELIRSVLPSFNNNPLDSAVTYDDLIFYKAMMDDSLVGYACRTFTEKGFNGKFYLMAGFLPDGTLYNSVVLEQNETPGFGSNIRTQWSKQFNGKNFKDFRLKVKKDGGDVDAISGATISSRAYCDAIERAYTALMENILLPGKEISDMNNPDTSSVNNDSLQSKGIKKEKRDSVVVPKPQIYTFTDKSVFTGILPSFDNNPLEDLKTVDGLDMYIGKSGGNVTGAAVTTFSNKGYNGKIILLVGFKTDGTIKNISVISQNETQYMGALITEPEFKDQFNNKNPSSFKLKVKDDEGDVDAISGSTISSRAFCEAIQKAYNAFIKGMKK